MLCGLWNDRPASSLSALSFVVADVGYHVSEFPPTLILGGSLKGGGDCPFYRERQEAMRCGLHVVNMIIGPPAHTVNTFENLVTEILREFRCEELTGDPEDFSRADFLSPSGDPDQNVIQRALSQTIGQPGSLLSLMPIATEDPL